MQPGPACRTQTDHHAIDRRMLCSWCSANCPLSFTSMSAVAHQSHMQATLACTTTVYPYSFPISPDVDICCVAGWRLMFKIMRTRCLSSGRHRSTDNIVLGVLCTKILGQYRYDPIRPISPNTQYPNTSIVLTLVVNTSASDCLERLVPEMIYCVSRGTLNSTHSLTHSLCPTYNSDTFVVDFVMLVLEIVAYYKLFFLHPAIELEFWDDVYSISGIFLLSVALQY